jgi:hypothetical protein
MQLTGSLLPKTALPILFEFDVWFCGVHVAFLLE